AGRLEQVGTPWELYGRPQTRFVAGFIGRGNFVDGRVAGDVIDFGPLGRVPKAAVPGAGPLPDGPVQALVRPEAVVLQWPGAPAAGAAREEAAAAQGPAGSALVAAAVIVDVIFGGERSLVQLAVHGRPWIAAVFGAAVHAAVRHVGRPVTLRVPPAALRLLPPA